MTELQCYLLNMLSWFHNYCNNNNLRYYALGGTMLGAVRHEGFIPWDDDIDVGMPRPDYNRLIKNIGNRIYEDYYLETPFSTYSDYKYPYCKLYNTKTTLVEHTWPRLKRGIFIDVFPLDGLGNDQNEAEKTWEKVSSKINYIWCRTCGVRRDRALYKNIAIIGAHLIPNVIAMDKKVLFDMDQKCQKLDFDTVLYGGNVFGNWGKKEIMKSEIMGRPKEYKFENQVIFGAQDYDSYLTHLYNDWKKLPPKEKQITHHEYLEIDLNKGYFT